MNKVELAEALAERLAMGKADAEKAINAMLDVIIEQLKAGPAYARVDGVANEALPEKSDEREFVILT